MCTHVVCAKLLACGVLSLRIAHNRGGGGGGGGVMYVACAMYCLAQAVLGSKPLWGLLGRQAGRQDTPRARLMHMKTFVSRTPFTHPNQAEHLIIV